MSGNQGLQLTYPQGAAVPVGIEATAVTPFASEISQLRTLKIPLDNKQTMVKFPATGTFLWAQDASDLTASLSIAFQNQDSDNAVTVSRGMFMGGVKFDQLWISNDAQAGKYITLVFGVEKAGQVRVVNPDSSFSDVTVTKSTTLGTVADVACPNGAATNVLAALSTRRTAYIRVPATAASSVRWGDSNVGAARGEEVDPGQTITVDCTDDVYIYNGTGAAFSVSITYKGD